jgi:hypothetical protein
MSSSGALGGNRPVRDGGGMSSSGALSGSRTVRGSGVNSCGARGGGGARGGSRRACDGSGPRSASGGPAGERCAWDGRGPRGLICLLDPARLAQYATPLQAPLGATRHLYKLQRLAIRHRLAVIDALAVFAAYRAQE